MPTLRELQGSFAEYLRGDASPDALLSDFCAGAGSDARFAIYRHTSQATLLQALRLSYPAVRRLVGAEFFDHTARRFLTQSGPSSAYLNEFGADFADVIGEAAAATVPYLWDVARLEWAVNRALHGVDAAALSLAAFLSLGEALPTARLRPQPTLSVLCVRFAVERVWRAVLDGDDAAMSTLDLESGRPRWLLIEREHGTVQVRPVATPVGVLTAQLSAGATLEEAFSQALTDAQATSELLQAALTDHLGRGRFIDFDLSPNSSAGDLHD